MENNNKIKVGLINFTNCLPLNYTLERHKPENTQLIYGTPAELNKLMAEEKVDVAPVSSFEYLKNKNKYTLMNTACISSDGECGSVLVFSKTEPGRLNNSKIAVPCDSASSVAMLKIILNEHDIILRDVYFKEHNYSLSPEQYINSGFDAVLFIGDNALKYSYYTDKLFIYDIGKIWKHLTGYPAVFGTWAARTAWVNKNQDDFENIKKLIPNAIETGLGIYFNEILNISSYNLNMNKEIIRDYLTKKIKYNFTVEHEKSLELFKKLYDLLAKNEELHSIKT